VLVSAKDVIAHPRIVSDSLERLGAQWFALRGVAAELIERSLAFEFVSLPSRCFTTLSRM
jgi:hypothetical protein